MTKVNLIVQVTCFDISNAYNLPLLYCLIISASMGMYTYYQEYNGRPAYHNGHLRLYFLYGSGWLLGPTIGGPTGYIHNQDQSSICPYLIVNIHWMYVYNGNWNYDPTLVVRCAAP